MTIAEAGIAVLDCEHKTPQAQTEGYPYIAIPDIQSGRVNLSSARCISAADLELWTRRTTPLPGDILVTRRGRVGDTAPIPADAECAIGQNLVLLRSDGRLVRQDYLRWAVRGPQWSAEVDRLMNVGAVFSSLNVRDIARLRIPIPTLRQQRAIAELLGSLDDKIAANTELADTASELSQVLYYEGVSGVRMRRMSEVLTPVLGGTPARANSDFWGGTHFWASAKDITGASNAVILSTVETISSLAVERTKAKPLPIGSVILTARGTVGAVARLAVPASFNQSCYGFTPDQAPPSVLYFGILNAMQRAKAFAHGSVFDTITMKTFDHLEFPHFVDGAAANLERELAPLLATVVAMVEENRSLATLRDTLIPELMSGRLRVRDAEKKIEEAV